MDDLRTRERLAEFGQYVLKTLSGETDWDAEMLDRIADEAEHLGLSDGSQGEFCGKDSDSREAYREARDS